MPARQADVNTSEDPKTKAPDPAWTGGFIAFFVKEVLVANSQVPVSLTMVLKTLPSESLAVADNMPEPNAE